MKWSCSDLFFQNEKKKRKRKIKLFLTLSLCFLWRKKSEKKWPFSFGKQRWRKFFSIFFFTKNNRLRVKNCFMYSILRCRAKIFHIIYILGIISFNPTFLFNIFMSAKNHFLALLTLIGSFQKLISSFSKKLIKFFTLINNAWIPPEKLNLVQMFILESHG